MENTISNGETRHPLHKKTKNALECDSVLLATFYH